MINSATLKISIITVCYNSEKTIETTIQSVISQDYPNIEYIIVDGKSKDGTMDIVNKYKENIAKSISEPDKGLYDAMNKGIDMATGSIIGILNSDDLFFSNSTISEIAAAFEGSRQVDAVYGNITFFKGDATEDRIRTWITKPYYPKFFDHGEVPPHPALFVKKSVYDVIGAYFASFKLASDYEFMLRAFKVHGYTPLHLDQIIVKMRMGGESTKSFKNTIIANKEVSASWKMNNIKPPAYFWMLRIGKKILQYINR
ncbi:MAG TPA: glycosyltransferase family 2 protein [Mucilaginibacter sp.]|nr:glycosyltransferase family 2 protein [Mucilaginibacter sp.]